MTIRARRKKWPGTLSLPPVFYDIEASSLDGVPIEIGWAFADPETGVIHVESHLIRPVVGWHIASAWDEAAERIHGISCGLPAICRRSLSGGHNPLHERGARRQGTLLGCTGLGWGPVAADRQCGNTEPKFSISRADAHTVIGAVGREQAWEAKDCLAMMEKIERDYPRTHRAAEDARHLAALWLAMTQGPG